MALKLMYITNNPKIAVVAENAGVDRIFIDMEYIGKDIRQGGMDTVKSHHTIDDIAAVRQVIKKSELLVRVNPIHDKTDLYTSSEEEITKTIENGADIIMLDNMTPEVMKQAVALIDGRAQTECSGNITKENIARICEIGVDFVSSGALTHSAPILDISMKHLHAV